MLVKVEGSVALVGAQGWAGEQQFSWSRGARGEHGRYVFHMRDRIILLGKEECMKMAFEEGD